MTLFYGIFMPLSVSVIWISIIQISPKIKEKVNYTIISTSM
jgi:hypothetical protein